MSGATLDDHNTPSMPDDGLSAALPEVSWQTCFWILVTLGLNTMAQPGGRVCSLDPRYSTYLRSSPFFCIADTLSILFYFGKKASQTKASWRKCTQELIDDRFKTHGSVDAMKNLRSTAWMRWLCFILGPLPQAVRLASFQGVPLTQLWGFGFVSSWLLVEIGVFISWFNQSRDFRKSGAKWRNEYFLELDSIGYLAALCQISFIIFIPLFWPTPFKDKLKENPIWEAIVYTFLLCVEIGLIIGCFFLLRPFCKRNLAVSQSLLVAFPEGDTEVLKLDEDALSIFVFSSANFLSGLGTYCLYYSPSGTVNIGWLDVFG